jgi:hypothetical protein
MNERIKLLATTANPSSQEIYESDSWKFNCAAWSAEDLEKFAELIVRECAAVSRKSSKRIDDMGSLIAQDIEKHFEIE